MGWARIDDGFHDHPKVDELSLSAIGLWTLCLTHAHRHRKTAVAPGHVTEARVKKVAGRSAQALTGELVAAGLWHVEPSIGGWLIHDFEDYLPRQRDSNEAAESGRKGAQKRWQRDGSKVANSYTEPSSSIAVDSSRASAPAFPSRPDPYPTQEDKATTSLDKPSKTDSAFDEFWSVYPKKAAKIAARRRFDTLVKRGTDPAEIIEGARRYAQTRLGEDSQFTKQPDGWLNQGRWQDEPPPIYRPPEPATGGATAKAEGWLSLGTEPTPHRNEITGAA